ncbi:MAG: ROK family glucokinase [Clostridiales bacterium]|nr:ROK family glucokinase [Clostridiales bacterium]
MNNNESYVIGVDLGGTAVKMGLFNDSGELIEKWSIPTDRSNNGANILSDIAKNIKTKTREHSLDKEMIKGIGIGVPGPVLDNGKVLGCVNLGWGILNIEKELSALTGYKVKAGNDANVAALGELWHGGGIGYKNLVMVTLGTGVGGGIVLNRKIVYGSNGAGGEIGHAVININETESCSCGNKGCLEQYCSATGIVRRANRLLAESDKDSVLRNVEVNAKSVMDAAREGDEIAVETLHFVAARLGRFMANIAAVIDPQIFLIGGGVSKAGDILINTVKDYYREFAFKASKDTVFKQAKLGNDAGIHGCAMLIIKG